MILLLDWKSGSCVTHTIPRAPSNSVDLGGLARFCESVGYSSIKIAENSSLTALRGNWAWRLSGDPRRSFHEIGIVLADEAIVISIRTFGFRVWTFYDLEVFRVEMEMLEEYIKSRRISDERMSLVQRQRRWAFLSVLCVVFLFALLCSIGGASTYVFLSSH